MNALNVLFQRVLTVALAAALLASLAACGEEKGEQISPAPVTSPTAASTQPSESPAVTPEESVEPTPSGPELAETEDMGQSYIDEITFLGDSTTYGLRA